MGCLLLDNQLIKSISEGIIRIMKLSCLFYSLNSLKEFNDYLKKINSSKRIKNTLILQKERKVFSKYIRIYYFVSDENIKTNGVPIISVYSVNRCTYYRLFVNIC